MGFRISFLGLIDILVISGIRNLIWNLIFRTSSSQ